MLKQTLITLLQRQNSEKIIRDCLVWTPHSDEGIEAGKDFVLLFRHDNPTLTLDQIRGIRALLTTTWMKQNYSSVDYKYSQKASLFNAVLRCAEDSLCLENNQPACKYSDIIGWHELSMQLGEDLFTTSMMAAYDSKRGRKRKTFLWQPYINTVHPALAEIYQKPLTELHAHLKGTSLNFDLNWMSLMNHVQNRGTDFEKFGMRQHEQVTVQMEDHVTDLYHQVMKAAAIRLYLFDVIYGNSPDVKQCVFDILRSQSRQEALFCGMELQTLIDSYRTMFGKRYYRQDSGYDIVDYAINNNSDNNGKDKLTSVLSGEREFLYLQMKRCYEGRLPQQQERLLTAYLVIKTRLRQEMVQLNPGVGFDNFATYEDRKTAFIKDGTVYERLLPQLAIGNFLKTKPDRRYMEVRIVPKETAGDVRRQIKKTDLDVHNSQFDNGQGWRYYYLYHFIKAADKTNDPLIELVPRHHALREKVKRQAKAIYKYRNFNVLDKHRLVGIDAANSEILARPEVFAQAFRYLRRHSICDEVQNRPNDLGLTYHVGEDFMDVADGLRAYDEVIKFLKFEEGDRLGHALVLGVDVETYYRRRNNTIALPVQMILDNTVWLYEECKSIGDPYLLTPLLERDYENYFRIVYGGRIPMCSIHTFYHSWLLRGDNPFCYQSPSEKPEPIFSVDEWEMHNLVVGDKEIESARMDETARLLYCLYHFDKGVKENGKKVEEYHVTQPYVMTLGIIRDRKLQEAETRHLAIECNPTSNYKIGELTDYAEHPITTFYNERIGNGKGHCLSVSINTDDAGVFATSIEREYAVMAKALEERYCKNDGLSPKHVCDWIDDVRRFGLQQMLVKDGIE